MFSVPLLLRARIETAAPDNNQAPEINTFYVPPLTQVFLGTTASISTQLAFYDPDGDPLAFTAENLPTGLAIDLHTGLISGVLDPTHIPGEIVVTITATDPSGAFVSFDRPISIAKAAVTALDDTYTVQAFGTVSGNLGDNDILERPEGVTLPEYFFFQPDNVPFAGPSYGELSINPDGSFTYTPNGNIFGSDRFGYGVRGPDGAESTAIATVTIEPSGGEEYANPVALETVSAVALMQFDPTSGRPIDVASVELQLDASIVSGYATGDASDILEQLELFAPLYFANGGGSGDGPVALFHPTDGLPASLDGTSVRMEAGAFRVSIDPSFFTALAGPDTFAFHYGYEGASEVNGPAPVFDPSGNTPLPFSPSGANSVAPISFSVDLDIVDDRPAGPIVVGPNLLNGKDGGDGIMGLFTADLVDYDLDIHVSSEIAPYVPVEALQIYYDLLAAILNSITSVGDPFPDYIRLDGSDGSDTTAGFFELEASGRNSVIFGRDALDAGKGGTGGNGTDGAPGFLLPNFQGTYFPFDGEPGANGGDGGDGGDSIYSLIGGSGSNIIVGGKGGDAGEQGLDGQNGKVGDSETRPTIVGTTVTADGGQGGFGGTGGAGGSSRYTITAGAGNDTIYGGDGGRGGDGHRGGQSVYEIWAGDGDDIIYGGKGGFGGGLGSSGGGGSVYAIYGGDGDDIIYGGAAGETWDGIISGNGVLGRADYILDGGNGNDLLIIGAPDLDQDYSIGVNLNAAFHIGTNVSMGLVGPVRNSGLYEVRGGAGDDTIDLPWAFSRDLRIDGGDGFDTLIMRHPQMNEGRLYSIDFNAGAYDRVLPVTGAEPYVVSTPAIRDMIDNIEKFVFDGTADDFAAKLSAASIIAMTTPQPNEFDDFHELFIEGVGDVTVTLTDGEDWSDSGLYTFDGVSYTRYLNADQNVILNAWGADILFA